MPQGPVLPTLALLGAVGAIVLLFIQFTMFSTSYVFAGLLAPLALATTGVDIAWHAPEKYWVNDLQQVLGDTGTNGFVFNSSELPEGVPYGTYNWCNMPHVRNEEYPIADQEYELQYVEVIHRHHKRTPYADNTFPRESYGWSCSDEGLFYYASPLSPPSDPSSSTYWNISKSGINPFPQRGFNGTCQFPQITREGLEDSWQHGQDLWGVYGELLGFLDGSSSSERKARRHDGDHDDDDAEVNTDSITFRVTANVITSQVAGMLVQGMLSPAPSTPYPLLRAPDGTDSLEPSYSCPRSSSLFSSYGVGSSTANWTEHLTASSELFAALDVISGVSPTDNAWHRSWDHYFDNLSARQCHAKPLPCSLADGAQCVSQEQADAVYRLGQYEYSYIYRDAPASLSASTPSFGLWLAELALHIRSNIAGTDSVKYRHNVAHDGSVSRLLSILQLSRMVWPGMGAEVVFEVYKKSEGYGEEQSKRYLRILWGGQVLTSSNPSLGKVDMIDVDIFLKYVDGLVGENAGRIVELCAAG